ncbi:YciI family protein [Amycolatopsis ultiminotia]|uniref:YciI family protein n=1 Tax=Amycolatopsis ultiminotia TaxID=543629 RepID=A0ABP6XRQ8_9PSEU
MILVNGSQQDFETDLPAEEMKAIGAALDEFNDNLRESGEFLDAQGLAAPAEARRIKIKEGIPVVTDGPYGETQEVVIGYWLVECESYDRATEIAAQLARCPGPESVIDVRSIME